MKSKKIVSIVIALVAIGMQTAAGQTVAGATEINQSACLANNNTYSIDNGGEYIITQDIPDCLIGSVFNFMLPDSIILDGEGHTVGGIGFSASSQPGYYIPGEYRISNLTAGGIRLEVTYNDNSAYPAIQIDNITAQGLVIIGFGMGYIPSQITNTNISDFQMGQSSYFDIEYNRFGSVSLIMDNHCTIANNTITNSSEISMDNSSLNNIIYNNTFINPATSNISGTIKYSNNGTGASGASINLTNMTGVIASIITDNSGYYNFSVLPAGNYSINTSKIGYFSNSSSILLNPGQTIEANLTLWLKGDLNNNGISADAGDLVLMKRASIGEIPADFRYDLNNDGIPADAGDLVLMKRASVGEINLRSPH